MWEMATINKIIQLFFSFFKFRVGGTIASNSNGNSEGNSLGTMGGMSTTEQNIHVMVSRFGINILKLINNSYV